MLFARLAQKQLATTIMVSDWANYPPPFLKKIIKRKSNQDLFSMLTDVGKEPKLTQ
jgi:hypothetical protein